MIRLILGPSGEVGVDLVGGRFGRGAHVHASAACIHAAPRGLAKAFHRNVQASGDDLVQAIQTAVGRRVAGLVASAVRTKRIYVGAEMAGDAYRSGRVPLLVVAADAAAAATVGSVQQAVAMGAAVVWGTKRELGALVDRSDVAVLGIEDQKLSAAVKAAVLMGNCMAPGGKQREAVAPRNALATEDR